MHCLPFTLKRAHYASLKVLRPFTLPLDLTPARFDLLYALHLNRYHRPFQWWLARVLGVTRATVCKMIGALRRLGMIELSIDGKNVHARRISLTRLGRKRFARALKIVRRGKIEAMIRGAWRRMELSRRETGYIVDEVINIVQRYSRGIDEFAVLYRHPRQLSVT